MKHGQQLSRQWPVRIVAPNEEAAQLGAMNWAQLQEPVDIDPTAERFANFAETMDVVGRVDCIGESLLDESLRYFQRANAAKEQPTNDDEKSAKPK
jgi:hypothetical protein